MTKNEKRAAKLAEMAGGSQEPVDLVLQQPPADGGAADLEKKFAASLAAYRSAGARAVENYLVAGRALIKLKDLYGDHGEWLPLLERNQMVIRTAQEMMKRTRAWDAGKYADARVFPPTLYELDIMVGIRNTKSGSRDDTVTVDDAREKVVKTVRKFLAAVTGKTREKQFQLLAEELNAIMEEYRK